MTINKIIKTTELVDLEITGAILLSVEEAKALPDHLRWYKNWWWLRSPGDYSGSAAYVFIDGFVNEDGGRVSIGDGAVRPVLTISNFESSNLKIGDVFEFGEKEFEIISS